MYPNPSANQHHYNITSSNEQDSIAIKSEGNTTFTNRDKKPVTLFASYESIIMTPSKEPAYLELILKPGKNVHAMYKVMEDTKDSVLLMIEGQGTIDYAVYSQESTKDTFRNYKVSEQKIISVTSGKTFKGTVNTNKGSSDLLIYMPFKFSILEKNNVPALHYKQLKPREQASI